MIFKENLTTNDGENRSQIECFKSRHGFRRHFGTNFGLEDRQKKYFLCRLSINWDRFRQFLFRKSLFSMYTYVRAGSSDLSNLVLLAIFKENLTANYGENRSETGWF